MLRLAGRYDAAVLEGAGKRPAQHTGNKAVAADGNLWRLERECGLYA